MSDYNLEKFFKSSEINQAQFKVKKNEQEEENKHKDPELRIEYKNQNYKKDKPCYFYFQKGSCKKGNKCDFSHSKNKIDQKYQNKVQNKHYYEKKDRDYYKQRDEVDDTIHQVEQIQKNNQPLNQDANFQILEEEKKSDNQQSNSKVSNEMEIYEKQVKKIFHDLKLIEPFNQKFYGNKSIDLMIIMDCTSSMSPWIQACKDEIKAIINSIQSTFYMIKLRISIIAYRDHCDGSKRLEPFSFSDDIEKCHMFLKQLQATGGGDAPEDVAGGLNLGLQQDWQATTKYAVLVADCPCHGDKYHESMGDSYPKGDPNGLIMEDLIKEYANRNIAFNGIKIQQFTDKMYKILDQAYYEVCKQNIVVGDLGTSTQNFNFFVTETVKTSISKTSNSKTYSVINQLIKLSADSKYDVINTIVQKTKVLNEQQSQSFNVISTKQQNPQSEFQQIDEEKESSLIQQIIDEENKDEEQKMEIDEEALNLQMQIMPLNINSKDFQKYDAICHTWFIVKDKGMTINWKKPLVQKSQITTKIEIQNLPFSKGAMRYAFYMNDLVCKQELVAKLPIKISEKSYNLDVMKNDIEAMFICTHIVNDFNDRIILLEDQGLLIEFVHSFIYEITSQCKYKFYYGENFIKGKYEKFNNNAGWRTGKNSKESLIAQTLSHFSWQLTEGYMMIVDLQGVNNILTDPQIHCVDKTKYGRGNLGYQGILMFFNTHVCNEYCKFLGLQNPKYNQLISSNNNILFREEAHLKNKQDIMKLCDLCRNSFSLKYYEYAKQREQGRENWCYDCKKKQRTSMEKGQCIDCNKEFMSSAYWFIMKKTDFPVRCSKCRLLRREQLRKELEQQN